MGKTFNLNMQDPAENMLGGGLSAGRRMAKGPARQEPERKPAGAGPRMAKAVRKAEGEASPSGQEGDVAKAWEKAGRPKPPEGHILNRAFVETKSKRLQVLMQPSVYERVHQQAEASGVSVNEMISRLLIAGLEAMEG